MAEAPRDGQGADSASERLDWHQRYLMLDLERRALALKAEQAESARAEMEASRFWRIIAPLRAASIALRDFRKRVSGRLSRTRLGLALRRRLARLPSRLGRAAPGSKARFLTAAGERLNEFLSGDQRLVLPAAEQPRVSIILVFFNQAALSLDCLRSIVSHCDVPAEVIVVDNASSDQTNALLERLDGVRLLRNPDNRGFVEAVNQAAAMARGEHLLLLNNDAELLPGSIRAACTTLDADPGVGAVGGRIVLLDGSLQEAGSIIWQDGTCLGYGRGADPEEPEFMFRREVDYCSGAFLLTPRALFEQLEGFDLAFAPAYYEETDYCVRLRQAGYWVVYEPAAVIRHFEFASSGGISAAAELQRAHGEIFIQRHRQFLQNRYPSAPEHILKARSIGGRQRLLLIDDCVPHEHLGAGYPRCQALVRCLLGLGFDVTFYPLNVVEEDWSAVYRSLPREVEVMLGHGIDRLASFLAERRDYYDQVVISRPHNMALVRAGLVDGLAAFGRARLVYDAEAVIAPREAARLRLMGKPLAPATEKKRLDKEIGLAAGVDQIVTVTEAEADLYRAAGHARVDVLGHALIPAPTKPGFDQRDGFVFVGALRVDGSPNVDSLLWFVEQVLPILERELGRGCVLYVVGESSAPSLRSVSNERVRFIGALDSLEQPLSVGRVFIAPTRFAAGIPHKVHAAAAAGVPVVATSLLARQLGWAHERELLVADTAADFVAACLRLYRDPEAWQSMRDLALASLARDCSPEQFHARAEAIFGRGDGYSVS